jgi:uncharacterized protein (DUF2252 family)
MSTTSIGVDHFRRLFQIALTFRLHAAHFSPLIFSRGTQPLFYSKAKQHDGGLLMALKRKKPHLARTGWG